MEMERPLAASPFIKTPTDQEAPALLDDLINEIKDLPLQTQGFRRTMTRLLDGFLAIWQANRWLRTTYEQTKQENAGLYHFLAATIERYGELRFTKEEIGSIVWGKRIRGYGVPGSTDVVFRISEEPMFTVNAPKWVAEAVEGHPVPNLMLAGERVYLPVFDITDLDATKTKK